MGRNQHPFARQRIVTTVRVIFHIKPAHSIISFVPSFTTIS
jgi:hypothetical protein